MGELLRPAKLDMTSQPAPTLSSFEAAPKIKILSITNAEHGQANVHLTLLSTLIEQHGAQVDAHLCSFSSLAARCPAGVTFHPIDGEAMAPLFLQKWRDKHPYASMPTGAPWSHPPTFLGLNRAIRGYKALLLPWSDAEYLRITHDIRGVIEAVRPDMVLVDPICSQGIDACAAAGVRVMTLNPCGWNAVARATLARENKEWALKWPVVGTGYPYPIPWYLRLANLAQLVFMAAYFLVLSPGMRRLNAARKQAGYDWPFPLLRFPFPILCPGTTALDLPGNPTARIVPCGPLIQAYPPLARVDPELDSWLAQEGRTTVLVVLGSHFQLGPHEVREMLGALTQVMQARRDVQVLWKLPKYESGHGRRRGCGRREDDEVDDAVRSSDGRLRVASWLEADPACVMRTGKIAAMVHHGGGNSYHEALGCGVPQIILAAWVDCYDFGQRAEEQGLGIWANRRVAPSIAPHDVCTAILRIIGAHPSDPRAAAYKARAAAAARIAQDPASMPLDPITGDELDVVRRARADGEDASARGGQGDGQVQGCEVAAEYVLRRAMSDLPTVWG